MKRSASGRVISGLLMTSSVAVPVVTAVAFISHTRTEPSGSLSGIRVAPVRSGGAQASTSAGSGTRSVTGPAVQDPYGLVQARVSFGGGRITNVAISAPMDNPKSAAINSQAIPLLRQETLQAQSGQVNVVSGATLTSEAYAQSLQAALKADAGGKAAVKSSGRLAANTGPALSIRGRDEDGHDEDDRDGEEQ